MIEKSNEDDDNQPSARQNRRSFLGGVLAGAASMGSPGKHPRASSALYNEYHIAGLERVASRVLAEYVNCNLCHLQTRKLHEDLYYEYLKSFQQMSNSLDDHDNKIKMHTIDELNGSAYHFATPRFYDELGKDVEKNIELQATLKRGAKELATYLQSCCISINR